MDHGLVKRLRGEVGDRLAEQRRLDAAAGMPPMSGEDERQFARAIVSQVLEDHARSDVFQGGLHGRALAASRMSDDFGAGFGGCCGALVVGRHDAGLAD